MRVITAILVVLIVANGSLAASEKTLVFSFRGTGVYEDLIDASEVLFARALDQQGRYQAVRAIDAVGDIDCQNVICAAETARRAGYEKALTGSLTRLGSKVIAGVTLIDASDGEVLFTAEGTALSEEDLDIVLKRLAISISEGKNSDDTARVGLITENEYDDVRRRNSYSTGGLRAGFIWPVERSFGGVERMTVIDVVFQHDTNDYFLAGKSGLHWGGDIDKKGNSAFGLTLFEAKIGRYLSRSDFAPFISAGIGISWARIKEDGPGGDETDSGSGLSLSAGTGFAAFRTYDFQFQLGIDYVILLERLGTEYSELKNPQGMFFTFCIRRSGDGD
ncbi:MAG: hypothetical protein JW814_01970 [Candidatus Krumholzibacteriota bacterium]|nr:hypothetical protein [Candidatus Krumholzibacteriota bacterium]